MLVEKQSQKYICPDTHYILSPKIFCLNLRERLQKNNLYNQCNLWIVFLSVVHAD
ncbi:MAG: hypothetical protein LBP59_02110 [Planctomycetaceae bacterium]|nr:hypothetical protein [Planctomycetaceae bacterium]